MKAKENKDKLVKVSRSAFLSLVASKLKGRDLFPEKNEQAKRHLQKAKTSASGL